MNITIIGTGYVGLVTGTCFAETGNNVLCIDIDKEKVNKMQRGIVPIFEPDLDILFERNLKQVRLKFSTDIKEGVKHGEIIFLALPTPPGENGSADLKHVLNVTKQIAHLLNKYKIIVNKSTVPVGTAEKIKNIISKYSNSDFDVVANPEFLREGYAVDDFLKPERIIIGTSSEKAKKIMKELYKPYVRQGNPIIFMDERSAELTKYAANAFLATKITFMNEIANLCELLGANVDNVRIGMGSDSRIGKRFLFPGIGYGGSCFPKDVSALAQMSKENNYDFKTLKAIMDVNKKQKIKIIKPLKEIFNGNLKNRTIAIWGLAFKPNTDDVREAPSLYIINELLKEKSLIKVFDPEAMNNVKKIYLDKILFASNQYDALNNADALIIATEWPVFRNPDFNKMAELMKNKIIFDGRNLYDIEKMKELNFFYYSIGREFVHPKTAKIL